MTGINIKNHYKEQQLHTNRSNTAIVFIIIAFFALIVHLFKLQVLQFDRYSAFSKNNRINLLPIAPNRGLIYDRNGVILAENKAIFELELNLHQIKNLKETIGALNKIIPITEADEQKFYDLLKRGYSRSGVPIKVNLTEKDMAVFAVNRHNFPGVEMAAKLVRHYPYKEDLVHVLGYVGRINDQELETIDQENYADTQYIGKLGIEKFYEDELHGQVGRQEAEINARGRINKVLQQHLPVPGNDLYLTIDINLQKLALKLLEGKRGSVVAINPNNGEVLALASSPGYDPNLFVSGIPAAEYKKLQVDPNKPLYNRSIRGLYPPGSTVKPLTSMQGLMTNTIDPNHEIYDPGYFNLEGDRHTYHCWKHSGHGYVNLRKAIIQSCDVYFYNVAKALGIDNLEYIFKQFNYGTKTNIDISDELPGLVPSRAWKSQVRKESWYPGETINIGIGQGYLLVTPMQLAQAASIIAARGVNTTPHLLLQKRTPNLDFVRYQPQSADTVMASHPEALEMVISAMQGVITEGTAQAIRYPELYTIAGKTGTSQVVALEKSGSKAHLMDHKLFMAFAPAEAPEIAIGVIIENAGETMPTPKLVARKMMDYYLLETPEMKAKIQAIKNQNTQGPDTDPNSNTQANEWKNPNDSHDPESSDEHENPDNFNFEKYLPKYPEPTEEDLMND
ncbi:MAG: penicillin-binding protein 2 [Gammaproteobacteria bacterium]|nr:penicillin-binding protein 2 [Gammaproteobacteria bacterium]